MNLIKNTLLVVVIVQLLIFSYIKLISEGSSRYEPISTPIIVTNIEPEKIKIEAIVKAYKEEKARGIPKKEYQAFQIKIVQLKKNKFYNLSSKVENYAKKFLGYKYVWGGTGPKTFDCSGFTQKVYRQSAGITIPRVSREQAKVGRYIRYSELKQGDMVFFDTSKAHKGAVNHVGIYLKNGQFIHASSGGKRVMITNFNKKRFYKNRFLWGRRVINDSNSFASLRKKEPREKS